MIHRFNLYWDAIYPFLCRLVGKRYGCCDKIRNCTKCIKKNGVDAVEIVRCKDCRFFHRYGFKLEHAECINFDFYDVTEDGYCCWAERREDKTD